MDLNAALRSLSLDIGTTDNFYMISTGFKITSVILANNYGSVDFTDIKFKFSEAVVYHKLLESVLLSHELVEEFQ